MISRVFPIFPIRIDDIRQCLAIDYTLISSPSPFNNRHAALPLIYSDYHPLNNTAITTLTWVSLPKDRKSVV